MATATTRAGLPTPIQTEIDFKNMTISELQNTCRENKWKGHSKCKVKKELVVFCEEKYKEDNADILCSICDRVFCDCSELSEKDKKIKELQDKVKEYELKELEDTDEDNNEDTDKDTNEDNDEDNFKDVISDESIICGKCSERGHNSYDCKKENSFEFNSEYKSLEDSTLNIYKNQIEHMKKKDEETLKEMTESLKELERLKLLEEQFASYTTKNIKEEQERKSKEYNKEREEEVLSCVIKKINYNIKSLNKEGNKDHKERYNLFINQRNGSDKQLILFHGTDEKNIKSIMENGLSLTTNKANGSVYGEGIYFTPDINYAMLYPKGGNYIKNILICQVYVNNIIEGKKAMTTFPKVHGKDVYYDTSVNNLRDLKIYVKKDLEQINILAHIQIDIRSINKSISNGLQNINKFSIKVMNKTNNTIYIYWDNNQLNNMQGNIYNIDLTQCKIMGQPVLPNDTNPITTKIGHRFVVGYYDNDKHFNIVKVIVARINRGTFIIN
jgi:hypothetical protein